MSVSGVRVVKSVTGLWPRSAHKMGHRPPFDFCRSCSRSWNVLLCRLIPSLALNLQPLDVCVRERGIAFSAYEGLDVFSFASMDVYSPRHLK